MRTFLIYAAILSGTLAMAQSPNQFLQNQQQTSGLVGVAPGQSARLNVVYPTAPAPILQILCSAALAISDDQGKILKTNNIAQLTAGKSFSISLNADTDLAGNARTQIYGFSVAPVGCNLRATLEIIDNITQKTVVVVGGEPTYPVVQTGTGTPGTSVPPVFAPLPPPGK
jgi:hypothetical protein